jgi:predicted DsbA family dithiol-disulfide isomerase
VDVRWLAFPLHPETPEEGVTLEEMFKGRNVDIDAMMKKLKSVAGSLGLPLGNRKRTYNSRLAQELGKWAEKEGREDAFHMAMFQAYFVDGKNLAKTDVLIEIVEGLCMDAQAARRVIQERAFKDAVDRDWQVAYERGITAVPTFLANGMRLVGAQSYAALEGLVNAGLSSKG